MLKPVVGTNDVRKIDISAAEQLVEKEEGGPSRAACNDPDNDHRSQRVVGRGCGNRGARGDHSSCWERDTAMAKVGGPMLRELYEQAGAAVSDPSWPDPKRCPVCETTLTGHCRSICANA